MQKETSHPLKEDRGTAFREERKGKGGDEPNSSGREEGRREVPPDSLFREEKRREGKKRLF